MQVGEPEIVSSGGKEKKTPLFLYYVRGRCKLSDGLSAIQNHNSSWSVHMNLQKLIMRMEYTRLLKRFQTHVDSLQPDVRTE